MSEHKIQQVETLIDELISRSNRLSAENQLLRHEKASWQNERKALLEKNELASRKVEAIIARLKSLEANVS